MRYVLTYVDNLRDAFMPDRERSRKRHGPTDRADDRVDETCSHTELHCA